MALHERSSPGLEDPDLPEVRGKGVALPKRARWAGALARHAARQRMLDLYAALIPWPAFIESMTKDPRRFGKALR